jgi:polygalacturonase
MHRPRTLGWLACALCACTDDTVDAGEQVQSGVSSDYTPYATNPIQPVDNAPFAVPMFTRPSFHKQIFDISDYGATADGITKNTAAIARAVAAAKHAGGGQVLVPPGRWLTGPIQITNDDGSCDGIDLHVADAATLVFSSDYTDYLPAVRTRWEGMDVMNYSPLVYVRGCTNVALTGEGRLVGQGWQWWKWKDDCACTNTGSHVDSCKWSDPKLAAAGSSCACPVVPQSKLTGTSFSCNPDAYRLYDKVVHDVPVEERVMALLDESSPEGVRGHLRPVFVEFNDCKNVLIEGVHVEYGPFWTIHPVYSENVVIRQVEIVTFVQGDTYYFTDASGAAMSAKAANGDGINPDSSRNVLIEDSLLNTSDDVVAIKSGLNQDGWRVGKPSENIVVRRIQSGGGHGGVTVGSEMSGGVRNVFAYDNDLAGETALRIKTLPGRGGTIENIYYDTIRIAAAKLGLEVTTNYQSGTVDPAFFSADTRATLPTLQALHYRHISGTVVGNAIAGNIGKAGAIYLEGISAAAGSGTAKPITSVTLDDFDIFQADATWNQDSTFQSHFPAEFSEAKSCLDVCGLSLTGVHIRVKAAPAQAMIDTTAGPELDVTGPEDFACALSPNTTCP